MTSQLGSNYSEFATGLRFPEGPVALPDGSLLVVEIERQTLSRIGTDGRVSVVAQLSGSPNGAAIGPDGRCYICNSGGFAWIEDEHGLRSNGQPEDYSGGRIEIVDLTTGQVSRLLDRSNVRKLSGPNDLVFDTLGGLWFTDVGKSRRFERDHGAVCYIPPGSSEATQVISTLVQPNGIGLSPDGSLLYVAETVTGRLWEFDIPAPGTIRPAGHPSPNGGRLVAGLPGYQLFDSLAVDSAGNICVATLYNGGITTLSPQGELLGHDPFPDFVTTNICFGGPGLRTAYVTCSSSGRVFAMEWPWPGLSLNWAGEAVRSSLPERSFNA